MTRLQQDLQAARKADEAARARKWALHAAAPDLLEALIAMEREKADYMRLNNLGDPSNETTNKMARAAISKAQGAPHE